MPRVKRGLHHATRRRGIMQRTKGFGGGRKKLLRAAKMADVKAGAHAYRDRRVKKRTARALWQIKINAGARAEGVTYSKLMGLVKQKKIALDRKVLSQIAELHPAVFQKIIAAVR